MERFGTRSRGTNRRYQKNPKSENLVVENEEEYENMIAQENMNNGIGYHESTQEDDGGKLKKEEEMRT